MGLADRLGRAFGWKTDQPQLQPTSKPETAKSAEPAQPLLKAASLKQVLKDNKPLPASRAWPDTNPQIREALKQKLAEEKGPTKPDSKPVEREATKPQPKLQPARTPGPGPSMAGPGITHTNRTSSFRQQQAKAATPAKTAEPAARKTVEDFKARDDQAADRQKQADKTGVKQRPIDRVRHPGEAPKERTPKEDAERVQKEQRLIDQFKSRDQGDKSRSR